MVNRITDMFHTVFPIDYTLIDAKDTAIDNYMN